MPKKVTFVKLVILYVYYNDMLAILTFVLRSVIKHPMQRLYAEFGRLLREHRTKARLSQQVVADRVGLSRTSITNIEIGRQHIPLHMLYELAYAVHTTLENLLPDKKFAGPDSARLTEAIGELPLDDAAKDWIQKIALKDQLLYKGGNYETRGSRRKSIK